MTIAPTDGAGLLLPAFAEALAGFTMPALTAESIAENRAVMAAMFGATERVADGPVVVTDHAVPGTDVLVRHHRPVDQHGPLPAVYSIHGGGYVVGSYDMDDLRFERWCPLLGCVGLSVEYRLAPEAPYPAGVEDCYAGLVWTHEHADELGIDVDRLGVSGASAGGGLAAALTILARERGGPSIAFQQLDCPMLDDRQQTVSSQLDNLAIWNHDANRFGWQAYLGDRYGTDDLPGTAVPAREPDLAGLPPACIAVGGADGFRDEDIEYALRLSQAGVATELHVYPGAPHGAAMFAGLPVVKQWNRDVEDWLVRQLHPDGRP